MSAKNTEQTFSGALVKPSELVKALEACIRTGRPAMVHGGPGTAKSALMKQVADKVFGPEYGLKPKPGGGLEDSKGRPTNKRPYFVDWRLILFDQVDLRGVPTVNSEGRTEWAVPDELPRDGVGCLFLDEINAATPSVQAAAYQLVLDRKLGVYNLPDGWVVMAAGNRESDGAVAYRMPTPLKNRMVHFELAVDLDEWCKWATQANIDPMIVAFLRFRPNLLYAFSRTENAFPTPRSWEFVSQFLALEESKSVELQLFEGAVGKGPSVEFMSFVDMYRRLPSVESILRDPKKAPLYEKPNMQYAVAVALARAADEENFGRVLQYLDRMPPEFNVMGVRDAVIRDSDLQSTAEFTKWALRHSDVVF